MGLLKDLQGLNAAYAEVVSKEAYTVTAADKKGNTPAYQGYKSGKKNVKTGEPMYKAADHLKKEDRESKLWDEVAERLTELHQLGGVQFKVVPLSEHHQKDASGKVIEHGEVKEAIGEGDPQDDAVKQYVKFSSKKRPKAVKKVKEDAQYGYDKDGNSKNPKDKKKERWQDDDGDGKWYEKSDVDGKTSKREKEEKKKNQKEEVSDETKKLIESGQFTQEGIDAIV
mgnify:CR=1 FL=1